MKAFWSGFEKQARYLVGVPLKTDAAKEQYKKDTKNYGTSVASGLLGAAVAGPVAGSVAEAVGKRPGKSALIGAGLGALAAGLGHHVLNKRKRARHAEQGYGEVSASDMPSAMAWHKHYQALNKKK